MQSTDMRSKLENSARSSSSAACRCLVAALPMALMKMLRRWPWQSPIQTLHFASRSLSLSASQPSSPIFSRPASIAATLTSRFALRAPLHVSLTSTAFSLSRCSPTAEGAGALAASQLPLPHCSSCTSFQSLSSSRLCAKSWATSSAMCSEVPPEVRRGRR